MKMLVNSQARRTQEKMQQAEKRAEKLEEKRELIKEEQQEGKKQKWGRESKEYNNITSQGQGSGTPQK